MNGLPTIDPYNYEVENNNAQVSELFTQLFPELHIPHEIIFDLLNYLSETKVNARILPKVIRGVNNILIGTGKGQVIIHVQDEIMNVSIRETDEEIKSRG